MAGINAKEYLIEFLKQSAHGSMRGLARFLVSKFPGIADNETLVRSAVTLLSPAISAWLEAKGEVARDTIPGIVAEIASELPRELKQELDMALAEGQKESGGFRPVGTGTPGAAPDAGYVYLVDGGDGTYHHEGCPIFPRRKKTPERREHQKGGERIIPERWDDRPDVRRVRLALIRHSTKSRPGTCCAGIFEEEERLARESFRAATPVAKPQPRSFAHFLGKLSTAKPEKATELRALLREVPGSTLADLEECDTDIEFDAVVACATKDDLIMVAKTLREARRRNFIESGGRLIAGTFRSMKEGAEKMHERSKERGKELDREYEVIKACGKRKITREQVLMAVNKGTVQELTLEDVLLAEQVLAKNAPVPQPQPPAQAPGTRFARLSRGVRGFLGDLFGN